MEEKKLILQRMLAFYPIFLHIFAESTIFMIDSLDINQISDDLDLHLHLLTPKGLEVVKSYISLQCQNDREKRKI